MDVQAVWLTLRLAALTTLLLMVIAVPLAWWLTTGRGTMRAIVQAVVSLPLILPPTVLGYYLLISMGPRTAPGRLLIGLLGHPLSFTFEGLLLGSVLYSLPFAVQPLTAGLLTAEAEFGETTAALGASPLRSLVTVLLPAAKRSALTAGIFAFTHTVGEFGVVLMLGGNIPGATRTLSISLYDLVEDGRYTEANRTAGLLVAFALVSLLVMYLLPSSPHHRRELLDERVL